MRMMDVDDDVWLEINRPWFELEHLARQLLIRQGNVFRFTLVRGFIEYLHNSTVRTLSTLCPLACQELRRRIIRRLQLLPLRLPLRLQLLTSEAQVHNIVPIDFAFDPEPSHMKYSHR
jgi:hypothetical protein